MSGLSWATMLANTLKTECSVPMRLADTIRMLRNRDGLTQSDVGKAVGVEGLAISEIELGKSVPKLKTVIALAHLFDVSLDYLVFGPPRDITAVEEDILKMSELPASPERSARVEALAREYAALRDGVAYSAVVVPTTTATRAQSSPPPPTMSRRTAVGGAKKRQRH